MMNSVLGGYEQWGSIIWPVGGLLYTTFMIYCRESAKLREQVLRLDLPEERTTTENRLVISSERYWTRSRMGRSRVWGPVPIFLKSHETARSWKICHLDHMLWFCKVTWNIHSELNFNPVERARGRSSWGNLEKSLTCFWAFSFPPLVIDAFANFKQQTLRKCSMSNLGVGR